MKFRKKPVEISAFYNGDFQQTIKTLEGDMIANIGDWIITGIHGEIYPCKPDIFKKTYDPADDEAIAKWNEVYG